MKPVGTSVNKEQVEDHKGRNNTSRRRLLLRTLALPKRRCWPGGALVDDCWGCALCTHDGNKVDPEEVQDGRRLSTSSGLAASSSKSESWIGNRNPLDDVSAKPVSSRNVVKTNKHRSKTAAEDSECATFAGRTACAHRSIGPPSAHQAEERTPEWLVDSSLAHIGLKIRSIFWAAALHAPEDPLTQKDLLVAAQQHQQQHHQSVKDQRPLKNLSAQQLPIVDIASFHHPGDPWPGLDATLTGFDSVRREQRTEFLLRAIGGELQEEVCDGIHIAQVEKAVLQIEQVLHESCCVVEEEEDFVEAGLRAGDHTVLGEAGELLGMEETIFKDEPFLVVDLERVVGKKNSRRSSSGAWRKKSSCPCVTLDPVAYGKAARKFVMHKKARDHHQGNKQRSSRKTENNEVHRDAGRRRDVLGQELKETVEDALESAVRQMRKLNLRDTKSSSSGSAFGARKAAENQTTVPAAEVVFQSALSEIEEKNQHDGAFQRQKITPDPAATSEVPPPLAFFSAAVPLGAGRVLYDGNTDLRTKGRLSPVNWDWTANPDYYAAVMREEEAFGRGLPFRAALLGWANTKMNADTFWDRDARRRRIRDRLAGLHRKLEKTLFREGSAVFGTSNALSRDGDAHALDAHSTVTWIDRGSRTHEAKQHPRSADRRNGSSSTPVRTSSPTNPHPPLNGERTRPKGLRKKEPPHDQHREKNEKFLVLLPDLKSKDGDFLSTWRQEVPRHVQENRLRLEQLSLFLSAGDENDPFADPANLDSVLLPLLWHLSLTLEGDGRPREDTIVGSSFAASAVKKKLHAECLGMVSDIVNHMDLELPRILDLTKEKKEGFKHFRKLLEEVEGGVRGGGEKREVRVGLRNDERTDWKSKRALRDG